MSVPNPLAKRTKDYVANKWDLPDHWIMRTSRFERDDWLDGTHVLNIMWTLYKLELCRWVHNSDIIRMNHDIVGVSVNVWT